MTAKMDIWSKAGAEAINMEVVCPKQQTTGRKYPPSGKTFGVLIREYLIAMKMQGKADSTIRFTITTLSDFSGYAWGKQINAALIDKWLYSFRQKGFADATIKTRMSLLSAFFRWGVKNGYFDSNPVEMCGIKLHPAQCKPEVLTEDEYKRLIEANKGREIAIVYMIQWHTGMRYSDAAMIKWKDIDMERQVISCVPHKTRAYSTRIEVPILADSDLMEVLVQMSAVPHSPEDPLLPKCYRNASTENHFSSVSGDAFKRAGLKKRSHSIRRAFITRALSSGVSGPMVMKLVGIRSPNVLMRYIQPTIEQLRGAVDQMNARPEPERISVCS